MITLLILGGALAQCPCPATNLLSSFWTTEAFFNGTLSGSTVRITNVFKGLPATTTSAVVTNPPACANGIPSFFAVNQDGSNWKVACVFQNLAVAQIAFLRSQVLRSNSRAQCLDGSAPLSCDPRVCPSNLTAVCSAATSCSINPCNGCKRQLFDRRGMGACVSACPDGSAPLACTVNPCRFAKAPSACPNAKCVPNYCGACSATWVDANGLPVCRASDVTRRCQAVDGIVFPAGQNILGYAVLGGVCNAIKGGNSSIPLFPSLVSCQRTCHCRDVVNITIATGPAVWFSVSSGVCKQITGPLTVRRALGGSAFSTLAACQSVCTPTPATATATATRAATTTATATAKATATATATRATTVVPLPTATPAPGGRRPCAAGSLGCCPNNLTQEVCVEENVAVFCQYVQCGNQKAKSCVADPCNACKVTIRDLNGAVIPNSQCSLQLPTYTRCNQLSAVTCPANTIANCGPKPAGCPSDWNMRCVIDPCSCKPTWMNEDMRFVSPTCLRALAPPCVVNKDCPTNYRCLQPNSTSEIVKNLPQGYQLQCIQETCTCAPTWVAAPAGGVFIPGIKTPCSGANCCPDGTKPQNCASVRDNTQATCQNMVCARNGRNVSVAQCNADPCDDCNPIALDTTGNRIDLANCAFPNALGTTCPFNPNITCAATMSPNCGPLPSYCPANRKISCVVDPCLCRSFWLDTDVRYTSPECTIALQPPCVEAIACPKLSCTPIPPNVQQLLTPAVLRSLVCVQEQCTCRPIWVQPPQTPQSTAAGATNTGASRSG